VLDEDEFAKTLIPELFKHNNYASFVRQLNMYGFHKKVGLSDNSMRASERKNKSPSEYANPYFKRGHPDLLWLIQKPKNTAGQGSKSGKTNVRVKTEDADEHDHDDYDDGSGARDDRSRSHQLSLVQGSIMPKDQLAGVYRELQAIRQQQQVISNTITRLRKEHEQLYAQAANFQEQHTRHENSINAILTFLATVYNRSLQGQEGPQNLANSFAGAISQDQSNVVDMDDYSLSTLGASHMNSPGGQRPMKKQPLLLKAAPSERQSRAESPSSAASAYDGPQSRGHTRHPSALQHGHVEEVFDNSPRQKEAQPPQPQQFPPQRDIMSAIQYSNARNGVPTSFAEFPNVLSSLETSNGNVPLTPNQRADMLRLMANETSPGDSNVPVPQNNALMTPTPPPMPLGYSNRLANTRAEIDNLVKMQAEQDRSVQNLTNLLQPLSPTGSIPGIVGGDGNPHPPPFDLDQIFNNDYFTDLTELENNKNNLQYGDMATSVPTTAPSDPVTTDAEDSAVKDASDLFDFDHIPDNGELFDGSNQQQQNPGFYSGYDNTINSGVGAGAQFPPVGGPGRIIETLTDSEATSPSNTMDEPAQFSSKDSQGGKGNGGSSKRRKKA
jgi:heat shock transcription factor